MENKEILAQFSREDFIEKIELEVGLDRVFKEQKGEETRYSRRRE